jgi:hypothetical protein
VAGGQQQQQQQELELPQATADATQGQADRCDDDQQNKNQKWVVEKMGVPLAV